jgi:hypothetical protein
MSDNATYQEFEARGTQQLPQAGLDRPQQSNLAGLYESPLSAYGICAVRRRAIVEVSENFVHFETFQEEDFGAGP